MGTTDAAHRLAALRQEGAAFRDAVRAVDPATPVPSCPGWSVADLVGHLGERFGAATAALVRESVAAPEQDPPTPPGPAEVVGWWDERFADLVTALERLGPDAPAWNWSAQPKEVGFWYRRLALETAVHRWDAQVATATAGPVDPTLSADGVAEVLDTLLPAGRRSGPEDAEGVVRLVGADTGDDWQVRVRGTAVSLLDTGTVLDPGPGAHVVAEGSASDLLLALWGRVPTSVLDVRGDEALLAALRTG